MVLVFEQSMFTIPEPTKFGFKSIGDLYQKAGHDRIVKNPTISDYKKYGYLPCLTLNRRVIFGKSQIGLRVQFSIPKALFGNNFDEVTDNDLDRVVDWLETKINGWGGVLLLPHFIKKAEVSAVHYSKNLVFQDGHRCQYILQLLGRAEVSQRLRFNRCDYRNEGECVKYHTNNYELAFYDKIKDLEQAKISSKRSEEKQEAVVQLNLLDDLTEARDKKGLEVLRIELRLNRRGVIRKKLTEAGVEVDRLTLDKLFNGQWSKAVLLHQFDQITQNYPKLMENEHDSNEIYLLNFFVANPKASIMEVMASLGMKELIKRYSLREIRAMVRTKNDDQWYRFRNKMESWATGNKLPAVFPTIRKMLNDFQPTRLTNFPFLLLNDVKLT